MNQTPAVHSQHPAPARRQHHRRREKHPEGAAAVETNSRIHKGHTLTDMTTSIQASVNDVEFELLLTIGLVVMVIFLFLRSFAPPSFPPLPSRSRSSALWSDVSAGYSLDTCR